MVVILKEGWMGNPPTVLFFWDKRGLPAHTSFGIKQHSFLGEGLSTMQLMKTYIQLYSKLSSN